MSGLHCFKQGRGSRYFKCPGTRIASTNQARYKYDNSFLGHVEMVSTISMQLCCCWSMVALARTLVLINVWSVLWWELGTSEAKVDSASTPLSYALDMNAPAVLHVGDLAPGGKQTAHRAYSKHAKTFNGLNKFHCQYSSCYLNWHSNACIHASPPYIPWTAPHAVIPVRVTELLSQEGLHGSITCVIFFFPLLILGARDIGMLGCCEVHLAIAAPTMVVI